MRRRIGLVLLNGSYIILLVFVIGLATYVLAPVHELFHFMPCKLAGFNPVMSYFKVGCDGISGVSNLWQFVYFMGPYLFYTAVLLAGYSLIGKHKSIKYLLLIPSFDIILNYILSLNSSDFSSLLKNTYPNLVPFLTAIALAIFVMLFTSFLIIKKYRLWSVANFFEDMDIKIE